ncbi:MAG: xanthine dehydrogenase family protein subunit M [Burkholderiales bacterium]
MHPFNYHAPASLKDAQSAKGGDLKYLAGGQSLLAAMKLRLSSPSDLVDLAGIAELRGIKADASAVTIGAMCTHAEVAASRDVASRIPALAVLAGGIGDRQVRNRGTLGGALANNDPAADYPAAVLGLGATVITSKRKISADEYFTGLYETVLEPREIITAVSFPVPKKSAYEKFRNPASRFALVGVFVAQAASGPRVAVTGAGGAGVFRVAEMEAALAKRWAAESVSGIAVDSSDLNGDIHASAEYRAHLVAVLAGRAVAAAG